MCMCEYMKEGVVYTFDLIPTEAINCTHIVFMQMYGSSCAMIVYVHYIKIHKFYFFFVLLCRNTGGTAMCEEDVSSVPNPSFLIFFIPLTFYVVHFN